MTDDERDEMLKLRARTNLPGRPERAGVVKLLAVVGTRTVEVAAVVVVFTMMVHVSANALSRTYFAHPLPNTLEIVQYWYLPTVALLGFVAAQARGQHIAADLVYQRLPRVSRPYVLCGLMAATAAVCAAVAWYSWPEAITAMQNRRTAGVSGVPSWPVYFLVPVVFAVLAVQFAWSAVGAVRQSEDQVIQRNDSDSPPNEQSRQREQ